MILKSVWQKSPPRNLPVPTLSKCLAYYLLFMKIATLSKLSTSVLFLIALTLAATLWWSSETLHQHDVRQQSYLTIRQQFSMIYKELLLVTLTVAMQRS